MLRDNILQILDINKEIIKDTFSIDENEIDKIKEFFTKDHENFKQIVDEICLSDMEIREKMVVCYMLGYGNGSRKRNEILMPKVLGKL